MSAYNNKRVSLCYTITKFVIFAVIVKVARKIWGQLVCECALRSSAQENVLKTKGTASTSIETNDMVEEMTRPTQTNFNWQMEPKKYFKPRRIYDGFWSTLIRLLNFINISGMCRNGGGEWSESCGIGQTFWHSRIPIYEAHLFNFTIQLYINESAATKNMDKYWKNVHLRHH